MDPVIAFKAVVLGIVEGLTEFLPISSTGHLIVAGALLDWNSEKGKLFDIVIQLAAILAVCWQFRGKLVHVVASLGREPRSRKFALNLIIAFTPAAVLGLLFSKAIKQYLFSPISVALAFIIGGFVILIIEHFPRKPRVVEVDSVTPVDSAWIGIAQAFSLVPGTSRSGATIMGGMLRGLSRSAATEFSFFLAIPTMFAATGYELFKARHELNSHDFAVIGIGSIASFISAAFAIRALLKYVSSHDFKPFAWYRIVFGLFILGSWYFHWIKWGDAEAAPVKADIEVAGAWARATPPGIRVGAVYATLTNHGTEGDALIGVRSPAADTAEIHESTQTQGIMAMRPISSLALPPNVPVLVSPGGTHIMLQGLKQPLTAGSVAHVTLLFQHHEAIDLDAPVRSE